MSNFYYNIAKRFQALIPNPPLMVGEIIDYGGGMAIVEAPGGGQYRVRSTISSGRVYFRDGAVESAAPDLPYGEDEV